MTDKKKSDFVELEMKKRGNLADPWISRFLISGNPIPLSEKALSLPKDPSTTTPSPPHISTGTLSQDSVMVSAKKLKQLKDKVRRKPYMWEDIVAEPFFHGILPKREIARILKNDGDFVAVAERVRKKQKVLIKLLDKGKVHSLVVQQRPQGEYYLSHEKKCFTTISDLIAYYWAQKESLGDHGALKRPIRRKYWEIGNHQVQVKEKIGSGPLGEVCAGTLDEPKGIQSHIQQVAIKIPRAKRFSEQIRHLIKQARHWRVFSHPNLLKVYGITITNDPIMMIEELAEGGTLLDLLQKEGASTVTLKERARYCLEAAKGMEYLEHQNHLHNALGARNCLLDAKKVLKIADYGLHYSGMNPRNLDAKDGAEGPRAGTPLRWQAPETLITGDFTFQSDIWTYGILVWEILSNGALPYGNLSIQEFINGVAQGHERMDVPDGTPDFITGIVKSCWDEPSERPSFKKIRAVMEAGMKKRSMI